MSNRRYNTQTTNRIRAMGGGMMRKGYLAGGQGKLDADGDGKITGKDFAMLRNKKKKKKTKKGPSMMMVAMKGKK
jgi:hypothetical protein